MLTTLSKLKAQLLIAEEDTSQDTQLTLALTSASERIERYCKRTFGKQTYADELHSGTGSVYLALNQYPVHSITELTVDETAVTDYVKRDDGILFRKNGWAMGDYNISVTYEAGYVLPVEVEPTLPAPVEMAALLLAKMLFQGQIGLESERIGDYSVRFLPGQELPLPVESLLSPYVRRWS